jgi:hypothetical protein
VTQGGPCGLRQLRQRDVAALLQIYTHDVSLSK